MARWEALMVAVLTVAVAVTASEVTPEEKNIEEASLEATGRTFSEWGESIMGFFEWMTSDYDEYDYDDYGDDYSVYYPTSGASGHGHVGYGQPAVGYVSPSGSQAHYSSYSSYSPYQPVHHPQHFSYNARKDDYEDSSWSIGDMVWGAAAVVAPFLLLSSAVPADLLTVAIRRRSFDDGSDMDVTLDPSELPLLNTVMEARDFTALLEPRCQRKLFCEITKIGENANASFMQRAFYYVAMLTPDPIARRVGLARTFRAARAGECETLVCNDAGAGFLSSLAPPAVLPPSNHLPEDSPSPSPTSSSSSSSSQNPEAEE